jgi:hypothetical protein
MGDPLEKIEDSFLGMRQFIQQLFGRVQDGLDTDALSYARKEMYLTGTRHIGRDAVWQPKDERPHLLLRAPPDAGSQGEKVCAAGTGGCKRNPDGDNAGTAGPD